jgi:hypothetical protein
LALTPHPTPDQSIDKVTAREIARQNRMAATPPPGHVETMNSVTVRERLLQRLEKAWEAFQQSYAGLSDAEMLKPGVTGTWSVKDILAHVTWWEEEAIKHLPLILAGGRPPRYSVTHGGINAFNAKMTEQRKHLSLAEVLQQQDDVHRRLLALVRSAPDSELAGDSRFRRRLRLDTYGHYPGHEKAIRRWRERR